MRLFTDVNVSCDGNLRVLCREKSSYVVSIRDNGADQWYRIQRTMDRAT